MIDRKVNSPSYQKANLTRLPGDAPWDLSWRARRSMWRSCATNVRFGDMPGKALEWFNDHFALLRHSRKRPPTEAALFYRNHDVGRFDDRHDLATSLDLKVIH